MAFKEATWGTIDTVVPILHRVYLWGPPGIGKTHYGNDLAKKHNLEAFSITFNEDQMAQEHMGHFVPKGNEFVWHDGPVAQAMQRGALIANELPRASTAVRDLMLNVLDDRELAVIVTPAGAKIKPHNKFFCICTANESPEASGMDEALVDRMDLVIHITMPHPALIARLNAMAAGLGSIVETSYAGSGEGGRLSTRLALSYGRLIMAGMEQENCAEIVWRDRAVDFLALLKTYKPADPEILELETKTKPKLKV